MYEISFSPFIPKKIYFWAVPINILSTTGELIFNMDFFQIFIMKRLKYYDILILWCMFNYWITGVCGMNHNECDVGRPLTAAAIANAVTPNIPITIKRHGFSRQKTSKEYSNV